MNIVVRGAPIALLLLVPMMAAEARGPAARPEVFQQLLDCKKIADAGARLACYDSRAAALEDAATKAEVVVVDQNQVREAKRSVFGLPVGKSELFENTKTPEITQIESKVAAAREASDGWRITLEDGSIWQQTDQSIVALSPRKGDDVVVKRGAFGSFFLKLGKQPAFKVRRAI